MNTAITGEELKSLREQLGLTQDEMATRLRIAREWLSKLENGRQPVSAAVTLRYLELQRERAGGEVQESGGLGWRRNAATDAARAPRSRAARREDCEAYLRSILDRAATEDDPNVFPYVLRVLREALPLSDFPPETKPRGK